MQGRSQQSLCAVLVQFPVELAPSRNLATMLDAMHGVPRGALVVFPEGALSGYDEDVSFLEGLSAVAILQGVARLADCARELGVHLFFGTCLSDRDGWYNTGVYAGPAGERTIYRKVNLATSERGTFRAGNQLQGLTIRHEGVPVKIAIQLCREIRFPEQWQYLARQGAQIFVYMTNAVGDATQAAIWRSHLVSRAAENQRFVLAVNNAHTAQKCPTMAISPTGAVIAEVAGPGLAMAHCEVTPGEVSDWYLEQSRQDLLNRKGA